MNIRLLVLSALAALLGTAASHAASQAISLSMSAVYQSASNPSKLTVLHLNNTSLIKAAIAVTGTSAPSQKTSAYDIVIDESGRFIEVITKIDSKFFYRLGHTGTNAEDFGANEKTLTKGDDFNVVTSDYEFLLPVPVLSGTAGNAIAVASILKHSFVPTATPAIIKYTASFIGGSPDAGHVAFDLTGTFSAGKKNYQVVDEPNTP